MLRNAVRSSYLAAASHLPKDDKETFTNRERMNAFFRQDIQENQSLNKALPMHPESASAIRVATWNINVLCGLATSSWVTKHGEQIAPDQAAAVIEGINADVLILQEAMHEPDDKSDPLLHEACARVCDLCKLLEDRFGYKLFRSYGAGSGNSVVLAAKHPAVIERGESVALDIGYWIPLVLDDGKPELPIRVAVYAELNIGIVTVGIYGLHLHHKDSLKDERVLFEYTYEQSQAKPLSKRISDEQANRALNEADWRSKLVIKDKDNEEHDISTDKALDDEKLDSIFESKFPVTVFEVGRRDGLRAAEIETLLADMRQRSADAYFIAGDFNQARREDYTTEEHLVVKRTLERFGMSGDADDGVANYLQKQGFVACWDIPAPRNFLQEAVGDASVGAPPGTHWTGLPLDYFYLKSGNAPLKLIGSHVWYSDVSDHLPVVIDVGLEDADAHTTPALGRTESEELVNTEICVMDEEVSDTVKKIISLFDNYDVNGDKVLDRSELKAVLCNLSPPPGKSPPTDKELDMIVNNFLSEADTNNDGSIDCPEFVRWLWKKPPSKPLPSDAGWKMHLPPRVAPAAGEIERKVT